MPSLSDIRTVEDLNALLFELGAHLVNDKKKLAQWIRGIQESFADLYLLSHSLQQDLTELHLLKSFLLLTVENLKLRVNSLANEKEDMIAMHESDSGVKEHLIQRVNEQEKINMESAMEIRIMKKRMQEMADEMQEVQLVRREGEERVREVREIGLAEMRGLKEYAK